MSSRSNLLTLYLPHLKCYLILPYSKEYLNSMEVLLTGGENTDKSSLKDWINNKVKVLHVYGTTETTILSSAHHYSSEYDLSTNIGKVLYNEKAYVLSLELSPLPIGAIGELYIGGVGLARGYLNNPKLTEERFIPNLFQTDQEKKDNRNSRLYKTGDLVRWLPNGELEYIGRNDFQIKIRGFRIELGEIETVLSNTKVLNKLLYLLERIRKLITNIL